MSAKEMQNTAVQATTHYWGYRELDASELKHVGGGDDGGGDCGDCGDSGDSGGGCDGQGDAGEGGCSAASAGYGNFGSMSEDTSVAGGRGSNRGVLGRDVDNQLCEWGFDSFCRPDQGPNNNTATIGIRG